MQKTKSPQVPVDAALAGLKRGTKRVEAGGIEPPSRGAEPLENQVEPGGGGAESGATDPDLATICIAWPTLPAAVKAGILAMVKATKT